MKVKNDITMEHHKLAQDDMIRNKNKYAAMTAQ